MAKALRKDHRLLIKILEAKNINRDEECDSYVVLKIIADIDPASARRNSSSSQNSLLAPPEKAATLGRNRGSSTEKTTETFFLKKTKVVARSKTPWFDDEFEVDLNEKFKEVVLELWVKSLIKDRLMGQVVIPRVALDQDSKYHETWYTLQASASSEEYGEDKKADKSHEFQPFLFTTPQTCHHCRNLLWGINHSGMKCSCGACCHTKCAPLMSSNCGVMGVIRAKYLYNEEYILPLSNYSKLLELILDEKFRVAQALGRNTEEREEVAKNLVTISHFAGQAPRFLCGISASEIRATADANTIFRHNSLGSKAIDQYMKLVGMGYLKQVLQQFITEILVQNRPCELDPTRLEKTDSVEENFTVLEAYIKWAMDRILNSASKCPATLKKVFSVLRKEASEKFPTDKVVPYTVVTAFVFLRFFNAAILGPQLFGLSNDGEPPNPRNARTLTLISKTIQQLANMTPFDGKKEPYMAQLNHLVQNNIGRMKKFIDEITTAPSNAELESASKKKESGLKGFSKIFSSWRPDKKEKKDVDIERYLSSLHRQLMKASDKMVANQQPEEKEDLDKLQSILSDLLEVYTKKTKDIQMEREAALKRLEQDSEGTMERGSQSLMRNKNNGDMNEKADTVSDAPSNAVNDNQMKEALIELLDLLDDPKPEVRKGAIDCIVGVSKSTEFANIIVNDRDMLAALRKACARNDIGQGAIKTLINATALLTVEQLKDFVDIGLLDIICSMILMPKSPFADEACILLSNITSSPEVCVLLADSSMLLIQLISAFISPKTLNEKASFEYLANVFSNLTLNSPKAREFFMSEKFDYPIGLLLVDLKSSSPIRRFGVVSVIKNCMLATEKHIEIINERVPLLVHVLLPLAGPEDLSAEDMDGMPDELQFLESDKTREVSPKIRNDLVDILILLTMTREGREYMRKKKVYPIIRELHLSETDENCIEAIERLVNMLMRDENTEVGQ